MLVKYLLDLTASSNYTSNNLPLYYAKPEAIFDLTASSNYTSNNPPRYYAKPEAASAVLSS
jgi:hypothetical protein